MKHDNRNHISQIPIIESPVSYTHLDVYKRQHIHTLMNSYILIYLKIDLMSSRFQCYNCIYMVLAILMCLLILLDVYKRQVYSTV